MKETADRDHGIMLWGVQKPDYSIDINHLNLNIRTVIKYYHPDIIDNELPRIEFDVPFEIYVYKPCDTPEYVQYLSEPQRKQKIKSEEKKFGTLNSRGDKFLEQLLTKEYGIVHDYYIDNHQCHLYDIINKAFPPIITFRFKREFYSVLIVGYKCDSFFFFSAAPPLNDHEKHQEGSWGLRQIQVKELRKYWRKDILLMRNEPAETFSYPDSLLIRHLREHHHGYQEATRL